MAPPPIPPGFQPDKSLTRSPPGGHPIVESNSNGLPATFDLGFDYSSESDSEAPSYRQRSLSTSGTSTTRRMDFLKAPGNQKKMKGKRRLSDEQREDPKLKKVTTTASSSAATNFSANIPLVNRFEVLSDLEGGEATVMETTGTTPQVSTASTARPPPIILKAVIDFMTVARNVELVCVDKVVFQGKSDNVKLQTATSDDHRAATAYLKAQGVEFHTFTLSEDKKFKQVIRGLVPSITPEDIVANLKKKGLSEETQVTRMISMKADKKPLPLFLVSSDKASASLLAKITTLCYCCISVERYRNPQGPPQCYRCQKFGHMQRFCTTKPNCVKCGKGHESNTCQKPRQDNPLCCNCNGVHTANYRGCTYFKQVRDKMNGVKHDRPASHRQYVPAPTPSHNPWTQTHPAPVNQGQFPRLPERSIESHRAVPVSGGAPITLPQFDQSIRELDFSAIINWARTLMLAVTTCNPQDMLNVIISHAMPLMLVKSITSIQNGHP